MPKFFIILIILINTFNVPVLAQTTTLDMNSLIRDAIERSPEIRELAGRLDAARARELQETSLEDPMFGVGVMNFPLNVPAFGQEMMTGWDVMISQSFPFPGKLSLRGEIAKLSSAMNEAELLEKINEVKSEVKQSYFELAMVNQMIEIAEEIKKLLETIAKVAETKYSVGKGIQQDVVQIHIKIAEITKELIRLNNSKELLKIEINRSLNRQPNAPLGEPPELELTHGELPIQKVQETAILKRPLLQKLDYVIKANELEEQLAKLAYVPDFDFSLSYGMKPDRADLVSGRVTINLPVWYKTKQNNRVKEVQASIEADRQAFENLRREINSEIASRLIQIETHRKMHHLLSDGIIPLAKQALNSAIANYQVDRIDFLSLIETITDLLEYENDYIMHIFEHEKELINLELTIGWDFIKR